MHYIINSYFLMSGYRDYRFGLSNLYTGDACFFTSRQYKIIQNCNGKNDLDQELLKPEEKEFYSWLLKNYFIRECSKEEELLPEQEYRIYPCIYKDSVHFSITGHCNCRCRHCFVSAPHSRFAELPFDDCIHILDELQRCGIRKIGLTGGEPLCHPNFRRIVEEISKRRLVLSTLYTNGILLNDEIIALFKEHVQSPEVQISFDGLDTHDWIRGVEGSEKKTVDAIKRCVNSGLFTHISMMLYRDNLDSMMKNISFFDSLGVKSIKISPVEDRGEWKVYQKSHGITYEEAYEAFLKVIPELLKLKLKARIEMGGFFIYDSKKGIIDSSYEKRCNSKNEKNYLLCESLKQSFYINSDGIIYPCVSMIDEKHDENMNILKRPLDEILDDPALSGIGNKTAADFFKENSECDSCEYKHLCIGGCRAKALMDGNGMMGIDKQTCAYFKDGWKLRKDKILADLE